MPLRLLSASGQPGRLFPGEIVREFWKTQQLESAIRGQSRWTLRVQWIESLVTGQVGRIPEPHITIQRTHRLRSTRDGTARIDGCRNRYQFGVMRGDLQDIAAMRMTINAGRQHAQVGIGRPFQIAGSRLIQQLPRLSLQLVPVSLIGHVGMGIPAFPLTHGDQLTGGIVNPPKIFLDQSLNDVLCGCEFGLH